MGRIGTLAAMVILAHSACAETKAAVAQPAAPAAESAPPATDAATPAEVVAPEAGAGIAQPTPEPAPAPPLIDLGPEPGQVQRCRSDARFTPLATLLAKPALGQVQVRGPLWIPAVYPCTMSIPEHCRAAPVLAVSKPQRQDKPERQLSLVGNLTPDTGLACAGRSGKLSCPLPIDGREYGVVGILSDWDKDTNRGTIEVQSLCRFR